MTIWTCRWRMNTLMTSQYQPRTQIIKYNQNVLQADQPIRLQYSNQIKLLLIMIKKRLFKRERCNLYAKFVSWTAIFIFIFIQYGSATL
jgi:hypothetical protein